MAIDKSPFLTGISVKEFLWGYPSLIISLGAMQTCQTDKVTDIIAAKLLHELVRPSVSITLVRESLCVQEASLS